MSETFLATCEDVIDRLNAFLRFNASSASSDVDTMRAAIDTALREIPAMRDWVFMRRIWRLVLNGTQNTGTVTYQASGGTYGSYQLTLSGATWPAWASDADIRIGATSDICEVDTVYSDTVLTLRPPRVPANPADIAADSSYSIGCSWYALPPEAVAFGTPADRNAWFLGKYIPFEQWYQETMYRNLTSIPRLYSVGPAPNRMGTMAVYVYPWSANTEQYDMVLKFRPRTIKISGHDQWNYQGSVSVAAGSTAVTGVGTAFNANMVGSIFRAAPSGTAKPTSSSGKNPYLFQQTIAGVTSTTHLTLSAPAPQALSGVGYCVADPVDMPVQLFDAFMRYCEFSLAQTCSLKNVASIERHYQLALQKAKTLDSPIRQPRVVGQAGGYYSRLRDVQSRPWLSPGGSTGYVS